MHPISSGNESWFPVFDWIGKPTFHKQLKRSFPSGICMWEVPCVFCFMWNGTRDALTQKKARFPCRGLNAGSSFISQDKEMSDSPVETLQKALGFHIIWTRGLTYLDTARGSRSSVLQMLMMPDISWIFIGIPISRCQLESEPRSHASLLEVSVFSYQA